MGKQQYNQNNQNDKRFTRSISDDRALKKLIGDYYERKVQEVANSVLKDYNDSNYQDPKIKKQCLDRLRRNINYYDDRYNALIDFLEGPKETVKKEEPKKEVKKESANTAIVSFPTGAGLTVKAAEEPKTESPA